MLSEVAEWWNADSEPRLIKGVHAACPAPIFNISMRYATNPAELGSRQEFYVSEKWEPPHQRPLDLLSDSAMEDVRPSIASGKS